MSYRIPSCWWRPCHLLLQERSSWKIRCIIIQCVLTSGLLLTVYVVLSTCNKVFVVVSLMKCLECLRAKEKKLTTRFALLLHPIASKQKLNKKNIQKNTPPPPKKTRFRRFQSLILYYSLSSRINVLTIFFCCSSQQPCGFNSTFQRNNCPRVFIFVSYTHARTFPPPHPLSSPQIHLKKHAGTLRIFFFSLQFSLWRVKLNWWQFCFFPLLN